jgi:hypothetical protein
VNDTEADIRDRLAAEGVAVALIDHWLDTARLPDIGMTPHEAIGAGHGDLVHAHVDGMLAGAMA